VTAATATNPEPIAAVTSGPAIAIRNSAPALRELSLELGNAAEEPERDPLDLHALASSLYGMTELVQEERNEEQHGCGDGHARVRAL